ncbi:unnamed protein product [Nesidiocoris tenuis]|uniref:Uncharacterized protein n=1 Tax=Nesidiocoris tenuis TaxID=355587 RepID=A0A6H5H7M9_9HEMI|nr:unnamed protein product [Nesidiocoris tenuis]
MAGFTLRIPGPLLPLVLYGLGRRLFAGRRLQTLLGSSTIAIFLGRRRPRDGDVRIAGQHHPYAHRTVAQVRLLDNFSNFFNNKRWIELPNKFRPLRAAGHARDNLGYRVESQRVEVTLGICRVSNLIDHK